MKTELQIAADKLIREIFGVKAGETVTITTDYDSDMTVTRAVADAAQEAGAVPVIIQFPTPRGVGKAADPDLPIEVLTAALSTTDVWIEFNHQWLLYSTPFERASAVNQKLRYMCLVDFNEELLIRTVGKVDTPKLQIFMRAAARRHRRPLHDRPPALCGLRLRRRHLPRRPHADGPAECGAQVRLHSGHHRV